MPEFATARQRITEFLRQRRGVLHASNVIADVHTDQNADFARLTLSDVEEILRQSTGLYTWAYFYGFHAAMDALAKHEAWTMGELERTSHDSKAHRVTCVGCPDEWFTYAANTEDARELFRGHQAGVIAKRMRDTFQNEDETNDGALDLLHAVWTEGHQAAPETRSPYDPEGASE